MKQIQPIPSTLTLAPTLAQRLLQLREFRNMTVRDLARQARFTPARVEDIESGLETWLSTTDRQKLARVLNVEPMLLQEVESKRGDNQSALDREVEHRRLAAAILSGSRDLECPDCGSTLRCSIQEGLDIEGKPIYFAKAFCTKCPFVLR